MKPDRRKDGRFKSSIMKSFKKDLVMFAMVFGVANRNKFTKPTVVQWFRMLKKYAEFTKQDFEDLFDQSDGETWYYYSIRKIDDQTIILW